MAIKTHKKSFTARPACPVKILNVVVYIDSVDNYPQVACLMVLNTQYLSRFKVRPSDNHGNHERCPFFMNIKLRAQQRGNNRPSYNTGKD